MKREGEIFKEKQILKKMQRVESKANQKTVTKGEKQIQLMMLLLKKFPHKKLTRVRKGPL